MSEPIIFLFRHAESMNGGNNLSLSNSGREKALNLANKLRTKLNSDSKSAGKSVTIWTSPVACAKETAKIIKNIVLSSEFTEKEELWSGRDHNGNLVWFTEQLDNFKEEILIIVSNLDFIQKLLEVLGFNQNNANYTQGLLIKDGQCVKFS